MGVTVDALLSYTTVYDTVTSKSLENDFNRSKDECYLDHAGATLYSDKQMKNVFTDLQYTLYANPHSIGGASSVTTDIIEHMRYRILDHFHTSPDEYSIIFTSGATASLKLVAESFLFHEDALSSDNSLSYFVYTQENHTSVLGMRDVVAAKGAEVTCLTHNKAFDIFNHASNVAKDDYQQGSNSLFIYPAQCNFSGVKYPLKWIDLVHNGCLSDNLCKSTTKWYVLLDAAAFVGTNDLDLSIYKPDFVTMSFYKMFGYPTGLGALLVKNSSSHTLQKTYYGGGTVEVSLSSERIHVKRKVLHGRFEDGTLPFLSIVSLRHGFDILSSITMEKISKHVFSLAQYLHHSLLTLHHNNGEPVVELYGDSNFNNREYQGGIVAFNLKRSNGEYVGYMEVLNMAALFKIHLRTGCFCNPGACQRHLRLSSQEILQNYDAGYTCGGAADLINNRPTGAVRASFGYMSTVEDVEMLLHMLRESFVDGTPVKKIPNWWKAYEASINKKFTASFESSNKNKPGFKLEEFSDRQSYDVRDTVNCVDQRTHISNAVGRAKDHKTECILERIYIYPIKSCAAYEVTGSWNLNAKGLEYDREWMIVTSAGTCLTQKQHINLCLLKPIICKDKNIMILQYPGMPNFEMPLERTTNDIIGSTICQSRICGHKVEGTDCGSDVSEWLSLALGKPKLRLVKQSDSKNGIQDFKKSSVKEKPQLSFSSQAQYLLINKASVMWLADQVSEPDFQKDSVLLRFRGNIVISGCKPFEEMQWKHVYIGGNHFSVSGPCTRCQMICIDQTTGEKSVEPLRTLAETFHGKLRFGIYLTREAKENSIISVGNAVQFIE